MGIAFREANTQTTPNWSTFRECSEASRYLRDFQRNIKNWDIRSQKIGHQRHACHFYLAVATLTGWSWCFTSNWSPQVLILSVKWSVYLYLSLPLHSHLNATPSPALWCKNFYFVFPPLAEDSCVLAESSFSNPSALSTGEHFHPFVQQLWTLITPKFSFLSQLFQ